MTQTITRAQLVSGALAACAFAGCLALAGCGEAPTSAAHSQAAAKPEATQPAQEPDAAGQDVSQDDADQVAVPAIETHGNLGNFEATLLDKKTTFTQEDVAQKDVTVINFWSTTCGPCITEMPAIATFAQELPDNVQVVTVCLDGIYNTERAETVLAKAGYEGATIIKATDGLASLVGQVRYTPTTVFVAQDGTLVGDAIVGVPRDLEEDYLTHINEVLAWMGEQPIALTDADQHEDA